MAKFLKGNSINNGRVPWNKGTKGLVKPNSSSFTSEKMLGKKNPKWKGDKAGYSAIHTWLVRTLGLATHCERCGIKGKKIGNKWNIDWALLKGKNYERKPEKFWMLCHKCHLIYDDTVNKGWGTKKQKQYA